MKGSLDYKPRFTSAYQAPLWKKCLLKNKAELDKLVSGYKDARLQNLVRMLMLSADLNSLGVTAASTEE